MFKWFINLFMSKEKLEERRLRKLGKEVAEMCNDIVFRHPNSKGDFLLDYEKWYKDDKIFIFKMRSTFRSYTGMSVSTTRENVKLLSVHDGRVFEFHDGDWVKHVRNLWGIVAPVKSRAKSGEK